MITWGYNTMCGLKSFSFWSQYAHYFGKEQIDIVLRVKVCLFLWWVTKMCKWWKIVQRQRPRRYWSWWILKVSQYFMLKVTYRLGYFFSLFIVFFQRRFYSIFLGLNFRNIGLRNTSLTLKKVHKLISSLLFILIKYIDNLGIMQIERVLCCRQVWEESLCQRAVSAWHKNVRSFLGPRNIFSLLVNS